MYSIYVDTLHSYHNQADDSQVSDMQNQMLKCYITKHHLISVPKRGHLVSWPSVVWVWPNRG